MSQFTDHKAASISQAEDAVARAWDRLQEALSEFEVEEREMKERTDQFVPRSFREARDEASRAQKWYDSRVAQLHSARAEASAPTLWDD